MKYDHKDKKYSVIIVTAPFFQLLGKYIKWQGQEGIACLETFMKGFGMLASSFSNDSCLIPSADNDTQQ